MYKLLCIDIDGTLRDECYGIPDSIHNVLTTCRKNGCNVMICTGRSIGTISDDVLALPVDGYIAGGGCYITYHQQILHNTSFSQNNIQQILQILSKQAVGYALESQTEIFMNEVAKNILTNMNKAKKTQAYDLQEKIMYDDTIHRYDHQPIHKLCLWSKKDVFHKIQHLLKDDMQLAQMDVYEDGNYYEIIQKDKHKGFAVAFMQTYLNIKKEETISFGDGQNDIEMLEASGIGIAMLHAHTKLKEKASSICEDIMQDGIYHELKRRKVI